MILVNGYIEIPATGRKRKFKIKLEGNTCILFVRSVTKEDGWFEYPQVTRVSEVKKQLAAITDYVHGSYTVEKGAEFFDGKDDEEN